MISERLKPGDEIRIIAPSASMAIVKEKQLEIAEQRMQQLGFQVTYANNVHNHDEFFSTSIEDRIQDIHQAFLDPNVKAIITAIGGYNANQLLHHLDYEMIRKNPKIFCGLGDTTALNLAINQKTSLITYTGPHFSTFGVKYGVEYSLEMFLNAVTNDAPYEIYPSTHWSDDPWYKDQESREWIQQDGYLVLQTGNAEGRIVGGNLSTLNLLQGTEYMPSLKGALLFIEEDSESHPQDFDRKLQSLLQQRDANELKGIIIGRFQKESNMTEQALKKIISTKREIAHLPVLANVNYGHVHPMATLPIGGRASITAAANECEILIEQ